jgi:hypothetical protein
MNNSIKKTMIACASLCFIVTMNTTCMSRFLKYNPRFNQRFYRPVPRFYTTDVEVTNAQILAAVQKMHGEFSEFKKEIRNQSLQKPTTTSLTTIGSTEADYSYNPGNNACNKYLYTTEHNPYKELKEHHNIHYGNR